MKIVNIGILAHVDAGKTTLTEQLLYRGGALRAPGSVDGGTAQTDYLPVERRRGLSVRAASACLERDGVRLTVVDTPGHADFSVEVERALSVIDAAVLVVSAVEGIQPQTELLIRALRETATPTVVFLNKVDRAGSRAAQVLGQLQASFGLPAFCFTSLTGEGGRACAAALRLDTPDGMTAFTEFVCEQDDGLLERYLAGEALPQAAVWQSFSTAFAQGRVLPALCGSALLGRGVEQLEDFLLHRIEPCKNREDGKLSALVYQITHDPALGKVAHVRLFGGSLAPRDTVHLAGGDGKVTQIRRFTGGRSVQVEQATAGDIVGLCGLPDARISDIIGEACPLVGASLSHPVLSVNVSPGAGQPLRPLLLALTELSEEDPLLDFTYIPETQQMQLSITGAIQLEVLQILLEERYGLQAAFAPPAVIYRETPAQAGRGFTAYTMPKPCWAVIELWIEPLPRGAGYRFASTVPNDQLFYRYQHHIEQTVPQALKQGLYNWQVVDLAVTLVGGEHHVDHTHPLDFFLATPMAVMDGLRNTGVHLLEPMQHLRITAPEGLAGRLIGDVIAMRGTYDAPVIANGLVTVEARVPVAASLDYGVQLAGFSGGRAALSARFDGYAVCPPELGAAALRRGVNPLDREKWILTQRGAIAPSV